MEEKLLESEQNYRYMFANNPQPMWIFDIETLAFLEVNQAAVDHYGYTREEFLSMTLRDIRPADDIPVLLDNLKISGRVINPGTEWKHIRKNGEVIIVNTISHSMIFNDRDARHVLIEDITERKQAEKALKESEAILNEAQKITKIGSWDYDLINNKQKWSKNCFEIYGLKPYEIEPTFEYFKSRVHPDDLHKIDEGFETMFNNQLPSHTEMRIIFPDGIIKWFQNNMIPIIQNNKIIALRGINQDITERKQAEQEINLKNKELQKLNAEKDKFFSIIAHDLRSPLGGLMKLTEMMADEDQYFSPDQLKEIILDLSHSARNIFNLLENLLEWSQMQRGLTVLHPQRLGLKELVIGCTEIVIESADAKAIELAVDIPAELEVIVDTNMFQSVIRNLVSNAIKFTQKGGKVTISARTCEDNTTIIAVKDNGIGMGNEILDNLFRIDAKSSHKGTEGEPGTGLGLLLCKDFIEKHSGKIWAESEVGKGSVFYFTLPYDDEPEVKTAGKNVVAEVVKGNRVKNLKILIVEDDNISEKLIEIAVISYSKEILKVRTGVEAVEACRNHPDIDLVLMDIQLPVMDGYEATRQIRKFNKKVIIIAQTAYVLSGDRLTALQAGCDDFISKPINRILLNALINKCFKKKAID
jgi:PAS domain S-box-containing protein